MIDPSGGFEMSGKIANQQQRLQLVAVSPFAFQRVVFAPLARNSPLESTMPLAGATHSCPISLWRWNGGQRAVQAWEQHFRDRSIESERAGPTMIIEGEIDIQIFDEYVECFLVPRLLTGNKVLLDNVKFHYLERSINSIEAA